MKSESGPRHHRLTARLYIHRHMILPAHIDPAAPARPSLKTETHAHITHNLVCAHSAVCTISADPNVQGTCKSHKPGAFSYVNFISDYYLSCKVQNKYGKFQD